MIEGEVHKLHYMYANTRRIQLHQKPGIRLTLPDRMPGPSNNQEFASFRSVGLHATNPSPHWPCGLVQGLEPHPQRRKCYSLRTRGWAVVGLCNCLLQDERTREQVPTALSRPAALNQDSRLHADKQGADEQLLAAKRKRLLVPHSLEAYMLSFMKDEHAHNLFSCMIGDAHKMCCDSFSTLESECQG